MRAEFWAILLLFIIADGLVFMIAFAPEADEYKFPQKTNWFANLILYTITLPWQVLRYLIKVIIFTGTILFVKKEKEEKEINDYDYQRELY